MTTHNLDGKLWAFFWISGWKIHFCPAWLLEELEQDARGRDHNAIIEVKGTDDISWDPGGMMMMGRSYQKLKIDTATLTVASIDFDMFLGELEQAPLRKFSNGKEYYKIHGWLSCTVFTPEQRSELLETCRKMAPGVAEIARVEHEQFIRALDEINSNGPKIISARDPNVVIEQKDDGSISAKIKVRIQGPPGGIPNDAKN